MKIIPTFFCNTPSQYKNEVILCDKKCDKKFPSGYKYKFKKSYIIQTKSIMKNGLNCIEFYNVIGLTITINNTDQSCTLTQASLLWAH